MASSTTVRGCMAVLSDLFNDEAIGGWAVPHDRMNEFVAAVENAARDVGAVPFADIDFIDFDSSLTSFLGMRFQHERDAVINEAEILMRSDRRDAHDRRSGA